MAEREHSEEYRKHMSSAAWMATKRAAIERAGFRCNRCSAFYYIEVHHRTYERLGKEAPEDLEVLCRDCHVIADAERAGETVARQWRRAYSARVCGWASKVFGDQEESWPDDVEEQFDAWLERRGER